MLIMKRRDFSIVYKNFINDFALSQLSCPFDITIMLMTPHALLELVEEVQSCTWNRKTFDKYKCPFRVTVRLMTFAQDLSGLYDMYT